MNILFIGSTELTSTSIHYYHNFLRRNHAVFAVDPHLFHGDSTKEKLWIKLTKTPPPSRVTVLSQRLEYLCRKNRFDLVFVMGENFLDQDCLEALRPTGQTRPLLFYHSHDNLFAPGILKGRDFFQTLLHYDSVFTTKSPNVQRYKDLGIQAHFLPSAYEPKVHHPIPSQESRFSQQKPFSISFIGTYDHSRDPYINPLNNKDLHIWGNGWNRFPHYRTRKSQITNHAIYLFEFADALSQSKLSLGLLREEAGDLHTQRTFEIPACHTLQLSPRNAEILSFFEEDKEIVCFDSPEELADKVRFYLEHDTAREKIAKNGFERCEKSPYRYEDRVQTLLSMTE